MLIISIQRHAHLFAKLSCKNNGSRSPCLTQAFVEPVTGIFIWIKEFKPGQNKFLFNMMKHSEWKLSLGVSSLFLLL